MFNSYTNQLHSNQIKLVLLLLGMLFQANAAAQTNIVLNTEEQKESDSSLFPDEHHQQSISDHFPDKPKPPAASESKKEKKPKPPPIPESACSKYELNRATWFDRTHRNITRTLCRQAAKFDRFFGDVRDGDDYTSTFVRIRNSFVFEQQEDINFAFRPRLRGRFYLPEMQEKFNLLIFDDSSNDETISSSEEVVPEDVPGNTNRYSAALRWIVRRSDTLQLDLDVGARFNSGIETFVKVRYRKHVNLTDNSRFRFSDTIFWRDRLGYGNEFEANYEVLLTEHKLFRWENRYTFSEESAGIDWHQRIVYFRELDAKRAVSYIVGFNGSSWPKPVLKNYGLGMRFRRNVLRSWLFIELEPEMNWPLERQREATPRITFRVEAQFNEELLR